MLAEPGAAYHRADRVVAWCGGRLCHDTEKLAYRRDFVKVSKVSRTFHWPISDRVGSPAKVCRSMRRPFGGGRRQRAAVRHQRRTGERRRTSPVHASRHTCLPPSSAASSRTPRRIDGCRSGPMRASPEPLQIRTGHRFPFRSRLQAEFHKKITFCPQFGARQLPSIRSTVVISGGRRLPMVRVVCEGCSGDGDARCRGWARREPGFRSRHRAGSDRRVVRYPVPASQRGRHAWPGRHDRGRGRVRRAGRDRRQPAVAARHRHGHAHGRV